MKNRLLQTLLCSSMLLSSYTFAEIEQSESYNPNSTCKQVKFQNQANAFANSYLLRGVMEVGSELLLEKEGKFKWYLAVGSLDQYAEGTWWKNGNCIGLKADEKYAKDLQIFPIRLDIEKKNLEVTWMGNDQQGTYMPAKSTAQ